MRDNDDNERHSELFAAIAAQEPDLPAFDSVTEVRAMRDEKDAEDGINPRSRDARGPSA